MFVAREEGRKDLGLPCFTTRLTVAWRGGRSAGAREQRSGAPVLWVANWTALPDVVAAALADDAALEARRAALVRWWAAAKAEMGAEIGGFAARWRDAERFPKNNCTVTTFTPHETAEYEAALEAFYEARSNETSVVAHI